MIAFYRDFEYTGLKVDCLIRSVEYLYSNWPKSHNLKQKVTTFEIFNT